MSSGRALRTGSLESSSSDVAALCLQLLGIRSSKSSKTVSQTWFWSLFSTLSGVGVRMHFPGAISAPTLEGSVKKRRGIYFWIFCVFAGGFWLLVAFGFWLLFLCWLLVAFGFWVLFLCWPLMAFGGFWLLWLFWLPLLQSGAARKERRKEGRKHVHGFEGIVFFKIFFYPDAVLGGSTNSPSFQPAFALKHSYVLPNPAPVESIYLPLYTWAGQKREFIHSFIHSFIPSFIPSFMPSFLPSFIHSFIHSLTIFCFHGGGGVAPSPCPLPLFNLGGCLLHVSACPGFAVN